MPSVILSSITFFFVQYFSLLTIKNLSPAHYIFSIPITFFFQKLFNMINTLFSNKTLFNTNDSIKITKFCLDIIGDIIAIIGFLIYLEIIVLNFCGLDYNIKVNINKRAEEIKSLDESINFN